MTRLIEAARYLTILPIPGRPPGGLDRLGRAAAFFPVVGLALGVVLLVVDRLAARVFPPLLAALVVVTVWKVASGGLHLDGLADCLDGLVGRDAAHRLAIMHDSRIGAFGAIGLILFLFLEIAAVSEMPAGPRGRALVAAATVARAMPPLVARLFPTARPEGHGALFRAGLGRFAPVLGLAVALGTATVVLGWSGVVALGAATGIAVLLARFMASRLGGVTGDVLGAGVEAAELAVLLCVSAWVHAGWA